jgi:hypothetical protein
MDPDREVGRLGEISGSLPDPLGDLLRPSSRRVLDFDPDDREPCIASSSMLETLVAAVSVELERCEKAVKLPSELLGAETDDREADDFDRREPLMEPPKMSPRLVPGKALKRLREMASSPKIAARERLMVGVEGMELFPVRNLNRPYWWTSTLSVLQAKLRGGHAYSCESLGQKPGRSVQCPPRFRHWGH